MPVQTYRTIWPGPVSRYLRGGASLGPGDVTPPVVAWVTPSPGSTIERRTSVVVDVTDSVGLGDVVLLAEYGTGLSECIYRDGSFTGLFTGSRLAITGGWRFTFARDGGWPASFTVLAIAVDTSGNHV